jgi:hypothetical protein
MFNQLTPADTVRAIGVTARNVARGGEPSEFDRDQLMSAYSATRHLVPELRYYPAELRQFADSVRDAVLEAGLDENRDASRTLAERLSGSSDPALIGAVTCQLLEQLSDDGSAPAGALRDRLHVLLRELADCEVELVAEALK